MEHCLLLQLPPLSLLHDSHRIERVMHILTDVMGYKSWPAAYTAIGRRVLSAA